MMSSPVKKMSFKQRIVIYSYLYLSGLTRISQSIAFLDGNCSEGFSMVGA